MFTKKAQADTDFPFAKSVFIAYEMTHNTVNEGSYHFLLFSCNNNISYCCLPNQINHNFCRV